MAKLISVEFEDDEDKKFSNRLKKIFLYTQYRRTGLFALLLLLLIALPVVMLALSQRQDNRQRAAEVSMLTQPISGTSMRYLALFGQKDASATNRNLVNGKGIYHASGIHIDRTSSPNKMYVVDTGNNRILGYNGAGTCSHNTAQSCTVNSDCGAGNTCTVDGSKDPDIVFGQADLFGASCNRDSNQGINKRTTADTMCFMYFPFTTNTSEAWGRTHIDTDLQGNLYMPDLSNNRVLKYNQPFSTDKTAGKGDNIADFVIGQADFSSNGPNKGLHYGTLNRPTDSSLRFTGGEGGASTRGVSADTGGNIWVADPFNHRILRFPPNQANADLVIGQQDFVSDRGDGCSEDAPLNQLCMPLLARVNPDTGELYIADEYPGPFRGRILVYRSPFTNGMAAYKVIIPKQDRPLTNWGESFRNGKYFFQTTGFSFNPYKQGEYAQGTLWVNEIQSNRTLLIDDEGNIIKVIGARDMYTRGGYDQYAGCPSLYQNVFDNFNLVWPGGSPEFDSENNIYLADEVFHRIARYALPYNTQVLNGVTCLPKTNGGLFPGGEQNVLSDGSLGESVGVAVFQNQLLIHDERKIKVWNNYTTQPAGAAPDYVINGGLPSRVLISDAVDDNNRLWTFNEHGQLRVYQLPITSSAQPPLADNIKVSWSDDNTQYNYQFGGSLAFDKVNKAMYVIDSKHRIFRFKNYYDFLSGLTIDMVIGQPDKATVGCNNTGTTDDRNSPSYVGPKANTLCGPYGLKFDKNNNLYVIENNYECHGNDRIVVFLRDDLQATTSLFPNLSAKKVFVAPDFTHPGPCAYNTVGQPGSPVSLAFNNGNVMVVGNDGYYGDNPTRHLRQLWYYNDPINKQTPDGYIEIPMGAAGDLTFDTNNNLIVQDHTWNRVWVIAAADLPFLQPPQITQPQENSIRIDNSIPINYRLRL